MHKRPVVIFGASFNPPCLHHERIVSMLLEYFDEVVVYPCWLRPDKESVNLIEPIHRLNMVMDVFSGKSRIRLDTTDFKKEKYTPTFLIDLKYKYQSESYDVWHVFGADIFATNVEGKTDFDTWDEATAMKEYMNTVVLRRPGYMIDSTALPRKSYILDMPPMPGSSTMIRNMVRDNMPINELVNEKVERYINKHGIY